MATVGGNLLQRTRCPYYRDPSWPACNRRQPGTGCTALDAPHRGHAILGTSEHCIATHPSDLAVALAAADATVIVSAGSGERRIRFDAFYRQPATTPEIEHALERGEIIVAVDVPFSAAAERSTYLKIRDRSSYAFALVSVAAGLELDGGAVKSARIALGGVGTIPWRARAAETALTGRPATRESFRDAAAVALEDARPRRDNGFKVELAKRAVVRALVHAASLP